LEDVAMQLGHGRLDLGVRQASRANSRDDLAFGVIGDCGNTEPNRGLVCLVRQCEIPQ
jgi:hypothetical protein